MLRANKKIKNEASKARCAHTCMVCARVKVVGQGKLTVCCYTA